MIELIVSMFIFVMIMGAMVAVSIAGFRSYGKSKAIKTVTEDVGFAINSIAKDARMGKIESGNTGSAPSGELVITRNSSQAMVCYQITEKLLSVCESNDVDCSDTENCKNLVNLSETDMSFDLDTSGFRNQKTAPIPDPTVRGWAEINLNIEDPSMEKDSIRVQTIVSSRDYGWEKVP